MKQLLTLFLLITFLTPNFAAAETKEEILTKQLSAILNYLERLAGTTPDNLSDTELKSVILNGVDWVVTAQEDSGHFAYEYVPYEGVYLNDDNIVRQAGTVSILAEVYKKQATKDPALKKTIENSLKYLTDLNYDGKEDGLAFSCVRSTARSSVCDLGATSLTLVGVLNLVAAEPALKNKYEDTIEAYVNYHKLAKFDGAGFSKRYVNNEEFTVTESPFFNGEALLALVRYYQYQPDSEIKMMSEETFAYLAKQEYDFNLYLWIMAALKDMQALWPKDEYVTYANDFTTARLEKLTFSRGTEHNYCAAIEGLASAYSVLKSSDLVAEKTVLKREIEFWLAKSERLQFGSDDEFRLVNEDGNISLEHSPAPAIALGGFFTGADELTQRIDFTQHCVSAYMQFYSDIEGLEL